MRRMIFSALVLAGALFLAPQARAQFTTVTATVTDPNGIPYAAGTVSAVLTPGSASGFTLSGNPYSGRIGPAILDSTGSFTLNFGSNALITPASTQWQITVNSNPGGIPPPFGTGPQTFTVTLTISGATQNISSTLNASAPKLSNVNNSSASYAVSGSAAVAPIFTVTDTNSGLGSNTSEKVAQWSTINAQNGTNCGSASTANGLQLWIYGDLSTSFYLFCNGTQQAGLHFDVGNGNTTPSGNVQLFGGISSIATNKYGDKCFSSSPAVGNPFGVLQDTCVNRANSEPPNYGEVAYTPNGLLEAYAGEALQITGGSGIPDVNTGQGTLVGSVHSATLSGSLNSGNFNTLYVTNGDSAISSSACTANIVTITLLHPVPTAWVPGSLVNIVGETGTNAANGTNLPILTVPTAGVAGGTTFTYALPAGSVCGNTVTVTSAYVSPVYTQIAGFNSGQATAAGVDVITGAGGLLASAPCTVAANVATITLNFANSVNQGFGTGHLIDVSGIANNGGSCTGTGAIGGPNGTFSVASGNVGGGAVTYSYPCTGCTAGTMTITSATVSTRKHIGGQGLYTFVGTATDAGCQATCTGATVTVILSCSDEASTIASADTQTTGAVAFASTPTTVPVTLYLSCLEDVPVQFKYIETAGGGGAVANPADFTGRLFYQ